MIRPSKTRALLATLRIANAPSVVSNVFLGYVAGMVLWWGFWQNPESVGSTAGSFIRLSLSGLLLYFSGNLANDWIDRHWDSAHRPERALPAGCFRPGSYLIAAVLTAFGGVLLAFSERFACGVCALAIVCLIAIYTWLHKRTPWAVVPMSLCRAGLYVMGATKLWYKPWQPPPPENMVTIIDLVTAPIMLGRIVVLATLCIGLASYIAGLSLAARHESLPDAPPGPRALFPAMLALPLAAMSCWVAYLHSPYHFLGMLPFAVWLLLCFTRFRRPVSRYVSALLAGIPLIDLIVLAPLAVVATVDDYFPYRESVQIWLPAPVLMAALPLSAFVLGRLLQRFAPAT